MPREILGAGVELAMDSLESVLIDVGVDLGRGNIGMAEHFLDDAQIGAIAEEMRSETVPQEMWINIFLQPGMPRMFFHDLPDAGSGQFAAACRQENLAAAAALHERRALGREICGQCFARLAAHRDEAHFVAFAGDANDPFLGVKVF